MWTRAELKDNAKKFFQYNYWKMVLVALIMSMIGGGSGVSFSVSWPYSQNGDFFGFWKSDSEFMTFFITTIIIMFVLWIITVFLAIFLFNPLAVGVERFFVVSHYRKADLGELGYAFSHSYRNVVKIMFLRNLYVSLWSLLFIIPGIIKSFEYLMIPYILAENPGIDSKEAFAMSKQMMDGNKWNAFVLMLSFLGWILLSAFFTCGILSIFYVGPYMLMTEAELYVALKEITYSGGQNGYQNMNQQGNNQWNGNNNQWSNNNQWNGNNNQWSNNNQWNGNNNQWNGNNNQWSNNNQWNNNNDQWNNNNDQWNNDQPNGSNQWDNNSPEQ